MSWLDQYKAAKGVAPAPQPQQHYAPPPQQPAPPQYGPQPIPGAPPHAPYGYDQRTGTPLAPYGYYPDGRVVMGQPQQPAYDPNGLPAPHGYDPAYNGPQQPYQGQPGGPPVEYNDQGQPVVHAMDAVANFRGGDGVKSAGVCPECGKDSLFPRTAGNQGKKLNTNTGQFVDPAPECANCGYNGIFTQMGSTGGRGDAGVKVTGKPRLAPGAGTAAQVAGQHGLPNLFAPK